MDDYPIVMIYTEQSTKTSKRWWRVVLHTRNKTFVLERMRAEPSNLFRMSQLLAEFRTLTIRCVKTEGADRCIRYLAKQGAKQD